MIRTQLYLTFQEKELLRQISKITGKSKYEIIRDSLNAYFENMGWIKFLTQKVEESDNNADC